MTNGLGSIGRWGWSLILTSSLLGIAPAGAAGTERMTKSVAGAAKVVLESPGDLTISPGSEDKLVIEAEPKVLARLEAVVRGDTLTIRAKESIRTDKGIYYTLSLRSFKGVEVTGSGNVEVGRFSGTEMAATVTGSGNIELNGIKPTKLSLKIPGSGNIEVSGEGPVVDIRINGSGNIDAAKFVARKAEARIDGSGGIRVRAEETLKASIDGAGNIEYAGRAKVSKSIGGAGNIDPM